MALVKCHECGAKISDSAVTCPHCGALTDYGQEIANQDTDNSNKQRKWQIIIFVLGAILIIYNMIKHHVPLF